MFCKKCGAAVEESFRFCEKCFADLSADGAVINNAGIVSAAAEKAVRSGNFSPDAAMECSDLSGWNIGGFRLSEKAGTCFESTFYSAVNISDGRRASVRHLRIKSDGYSDMAEMISGVNVSCPPSFSARICSDECVHFRKMCKRSGIRCSALSAENFISSDESEGHLFLISDGFPLALDMKHRSISVREIIKISADICFQLSAVEQTGGVYSMISEHDILIDDAGGVMLSAEYDTVLRNKFIITPTAAAHSSYIPPDIRSGESACVYSLAVMLYRLFNGGKLPYMNFFNRVVGYSEYAAAQRKRNYFSELQLPANAENMLGNMLCSIISSSEWRSYRISDIKKTLENSLDYLSSAELDRTIISHSNKGEEL